ncbi:hypothetical protein NK356_22570 [Chryseobacterium sp. S0630]|uniref:alpha-glutamyl/putrescinyl thymine pyrophosphorylase clade 3 protein n=1 Tax=Chryseobacterium sp. S0630 TaxID=2957803 RepID=UPI00054EDDDA|nr:hypothetical protein [Chryseobacterium sp. S0630]MCP1301964.1 hypothetical protein [Chryseobacterium sp. S0630]
MEKNETTLLCEPELKLEQKLRSFHQHVYPISIGNNPEELKYFSSLISNEIQEITKVSDTSHQDCSDHRSISFNPLQFVVHYFQNGEIDNACWLLFLYSYIGKHPKHEWNLLRNIYFNTESNDLWSWEKISHNFEVFQKWFLEKISIIQEKAGLGEYHKYSELNHSKALIICRDLHEYIHWIKESGNHHIFFQQTDSLPSDKFQKLYQSMDAKTSFNKLIKFRYLSLLGILNIFPIQPDRPYLNDFILSRRGAQHLFESKNRKKISVEKLNTLLFLLNNHLELNHGIEILQTALSKWGKERFKVERQNFKRYI